ncbi:response regulator [Echinicola strongylocentroti]|uniref:Response regulator n=1 Tax=Echinicola strongylocentroti TaxID=1795355 RepID=A0A2Z4IKU5_9BACT|nr:response regulator [Echinicola strongylocentroti]AWW31732.1 response regulator [Echinicola strongylocentroti]
MENKRILIVDDNNLNRKVFENIICHNFPFSSAENGQEAIDKIKSEIFDLILMDIQMPIMDGITALKIIKSEGLTNAPVIAISAYSDQTDRDYFLSAGFDDFIDKPVKPKDLLESISNHLHRNHLGSGHSQQNEDQCILDQKVYSQLKKYNSDEDIKTVYQDFYEEAKTLLDEIGLLIDQKIYADIDEKLHILKGNSGTLGARILFKHASIFEQKIKTSNYNDIVEDYLTLQDQLQVFKSHLQELNNLS